jgi:hypothetical protein
MNKDISCVKKQTEHIFNIGEKPVMEYICHFLDDTPNILFKDTIPVFSEPLIIKPIHEYDKNKFVIFRLHTFKNVSELNECDNPNRVDMINSVIKYKEIKEAIGFLLYTVKNVYAPIIDQTLINNKTMVNNTIELNEEKWMFQPKYLSDISMKNAFLTQTLNNINELKLNQHNDRSININELNQEYKKVKEMMHQNNKDISDEIKQKEMDINEGYKQKAVIGILITIISSADLKKHLEEVQKNNNLM